MSSEGSWRRGTEPLSKFSSMRCLYPPQALAHVTVCLRVGVSRASVHPMNEDVYNGISLHEVLRVSRPDQLSCGVMRFDYSGGGKR